MDLDPLFGTVIGPGAVLEPGPVLAQPTELQVLPSGFRVIDTLVPVPRGGLAELRGSGPLEFLSELIGNMATLGPATLVAVGTRRADANGVYSRLHRLVHPEATAAPEHSGRRSRRRRGPSGCHRWLPSRPSGCRGQRCAPGGRHGGGGRGRVRAR
jgi:hypothetical protein